MGRNEVRDNEGENMNVHRIKRFMDIMQIEKMLSAVFLNVYCTTMQHTTHPQSADVVPGSGGSRSVPSPPLRNLGWPRSYPPCPNGTCGG
jgi:hypothetical protein